MSLSALLRRTALRYLEAQAIVKKSFPEISEEQFQKLVSETVQSLAQSHLQGDRDEEIQRGAKTGRSKESARSS